LDYLDHGFSVVRRPLGGLQRVPGGLQASRKIFVKFPITVFVNLAVGQERMMIVQVGDFLLLELLP